MNDEVSLARRTLSRAQIGLFVAVALLAVITEAVVLRAYFSSGSATSAVESRSFVTTGLANIQREALLLQIETARILREVEPDVDLVNLRRALLGNQMRLQSAQVGESSEVENRLAEIETTLDGFDLLLGNLATGTAPATEEQTKEFATVLTTLERQVKNLYDTEEQRFFLALSTTLRSNQTLQTFLLALSALVLVSGGVLAVSLRRTVGALRVEMSERDRVESDLRETNDELLKVQDQVARSEKLAAIGQMSGGVAHDLRNPLGAIKNATYMVNKRLAADGVLDDNPKMKHYLEIIDQQIGRSNRIITDLMTFARVNTPNLTPTSLEDVLEEALATMTQQENVTLTKDVSGGLSQIMADGDQLQRVFLNLANNAQEAMPEGGDLNISSQGVNGNIEIAFRDTGSGISDENIERIFDPLFTTKTKGTGLGLAVCQEIVMRHGGTISAARNTDTGVGSTFSVKLPAAVPSEQPEGVEVNG